MKSTPDVSAQEFVNNGLKLVKDAKERNITIRLIGAVAVLLHCSEFSKLHDTMDRKLTDIDLLAYGDRRTPLIELIEEHGFLLNRRWAALYPDRYIFESDRLHIDVFFDKLSMCHTIDFQGRLEVDYPTIPLAELVLVKLQIYDITEKDLKDVSLVILAHDIGDSDQETINIDHISKILSSEWGFYYTVTENLKFLRDTYLEKFDFLSDQRKDEVRNKIEIMLNRINSQKKSRGWKLRARIGTRRRWYNEVEEAMR